MQYPLDGNPTITSKHGQATTMGKFGKHLGIDRRVVNVPFYAPGAGKIIRTGFSEALGNHIEAEIAGLHWRLAHLSSIKVKSGSFSEGVQLGITGNTGVTTGPHLHYDARKLGTAWDASFSNYVDPDKIIADSQVVPPPASGNKYTVKKDDTLSKIAPNYGLPWQRLYEANRSVIGSDPNKLKVGAVLTIPSASGRVHTVARNETLSLIARMYGTTWQVLQKHNGIANPHLIKLGQQIKIP